MHVDNEEGVPYCHCHWTGKVGGGGGGGGRGLEGGCRQACDCLQHTNKEGLHLKPPQFDRNLNTYLSCHNFFPLSSVQIFFDTSLLLSVCALR